MWDEPYLETCCRSALHRVHLCQGVGRPKGLGDQPCLERLAELGFVCLRSNHRYDMTPDGLKRHDQEIMRRDGRSRARIPLV